MDRRWSGEGRLRGALAESRFLLFGDWTRDPRRGTWRWRCSLLPPPAPFLPTPAPSLPTPIPFPLPSDSYPPPPALCFLPAPLRPTFCSFSFSSHSLSTPPSQRHVFLLFMFLFLFSLFLLLLHVFHSPLDFIRPVPRSFSPVPSSSPSISFDWTKSSMATEEQKTSNTITLNFLYFISWIFIFECCGRLIITWKRLRARDTNQQFRIYFCLFSCWFQH